MKRIITSCFVTLTAAAVMAGCSATGTEMSSTGDSTSTTTATTGDITVFAAASLKNAFTELGEQFEKDNPGTQVEFSFAGSSDLVSQITNGAPADVFASADTKNMDKLADAGLLAGNPANFATNTLVIVTAPGNPNNIHSFADLTNPELLVVTCAPQVPCGSATQKVETSTNIDIHPASEESSVTDVLNKVTTGQADAGLVYVTDAKAAGDSVTEVDFPEATQAVNTYPIAALEQADNADTAEKFIALVTGETGQQVLTAAGFGHP